MPVPGAFALALLAVPGAALLLLGALVVLLIAKADGFRGGEGEGEKMALRREGAGGLRTDLGVLFPPPPAAVLEEEEEDVPNFFLP